MPTLVAHIMVNGRYYVRADEGPYAEIQAMIDNNQYLKGNVTADKSNVTQVGKYYLLAAPEDLAHIRDRHVSATGIGSKFNPGLDLHKAILNLIYKNEPNEVKGGMVKWLAMDTGMQIGIDNVVQGDPAEVAKMQDAKVSDRETVKVKEGKGKPTNFMTFVSSDIGTTKDGKKVLSVITAFPGAGAKGIADRNDFAKQGWYFLVPKLPKAHKQASAIPEMIRFRGALYRVALQANRSTGFLR